MIPTQFAPAGSPINHTVKTTPCEEPVLRSSQKGSTHLSKMLIGGMWLSSAGNMCIYGLHGISSLFWVWLYILKPLADPVFHWNRFVFLVGWPSCVKNVSTWLQLNSNKAVRKSGARGNPLKQDQEHQQKTHVGEDVKVTHFSHMIFTLCKWCSQPVSLYISYSLDGHGNVLTIASFQMLGPK